MKVTFLGTGTSQGVPVIACKCAICLSDDSRDKRLRTSVMLSDEGMNVVIDTGPDFRQQMLRENVETLDAVVFTHEHKDHVAGLDDIRAFNFSQHKEMDVFATPRVQEALKREFHYVFAETKYPGVPEVKLKTIDGGPFKIGELHFTPVEVMHYKMPVLGFRVGNFAYVTDANYIAPVELEKLKGLDVLVLNALRIQTHMSHFSLSEALEIIDFLKPKKAYLTHISHLLGKHNVVAEALPYHVELAYDGLSIEV
ncbi:MAG: MBL fold metallo-hydrolase [Cryomorphaceae bacterium]|nr:MBL fold metallo-hydrolase [Cryomorphaceae bacterium]